MTEGPSVTAAAARDPEAGAVPVASPSPSTSVPPESKAAAQDPAVGVQDSRGTGQDSGGTAQESGGTAPVSGSRAAAAVTLGPSVIAQPLSRSHFCPPLPQ